MPKDQDRIEGRAKNIPAFVKIAQQALADARVQDHVDYPALKKALPTYAAKLNQRGDKVTVDHLIEQALQGADHIKSMSDSVTTKRALTYDAVVVHFPKPPEPPEPDLSLKDQLFIVKQENEALKRTIETLENKLVDKKEESD